MTSYGQRRGRLQGQLTCANGAVKAAARLLALSYEHHGEASKWYKLRLNQLVKAKIAQQETLDRIAELEREHAKTIRERTVPR